MGLEWITSRENPRVKEYGKLNTGKQARKKLGMFTLEGTKLCIEAVQSGVSVVYALVTESWVCLLYTSMRFRDIVLMTRDLPSYQNILESAFEKYGIPVSYTHLDVYKRQELYSGKYSKAAGAVFCRAY